MESSKDSDEHLCIKFELSFRRRQAPLLPWLVIGIALVGLIGHLVQMWIET